MLGGVMQSQKITFRCPSDLLAVIDDRIQESGEDTEGAMGIWRG